MVESGFFEVDAGTDYDVVLLSSVILISSEAATKRAIDLARD